MRVQRLNSFNEDGNSRARMEEFAMSEKDRLEHVLLCIFSEAALKSAFYDFLASNCMEHMLSFRDEVEYLKSIPFKAEGAGAGGKGKGPKGGPKGTKGGAAARSPGPGRRRSLLFANADACAAAASAQAPGGQAQRLLDWARGATPGAREVAALAARLYNVYVAPASPSRVPLDHATVAQCQANLALHTKHGVGRPRETNPAVLRCAFDEAVSKIFHQLVYEHLGYFLQSEEYHAAQRPLGPAFLEKALGLTKEVKGAAAQAAARAAAAAAGRGIGEVYVVEDAEACFHALLAHPVASYYFKGYLREVAATAEATGGTRRGGGRDR